VKIKALLMPRISHTGRNQAWTKRGWSRKELALRRRLARWVIGRVVRLTANYTPWDSNCFPQAITARFLMGLYRIPYIFFFGLLRDPTNPSGMKAHAWVAAGPVPVTGGVSFGQFTVVGCFVAPSLAATLQGSGRQRPSVSSPLPYPEGSPPG